MQNSLLKKRKEDFEVVASATEIPFELLPLTILAVESKKIPNKVSHKISIKSKAVIYHEHFYKPIVLMNL